MVFKAELMDEMAVRRALMRIAHQIIEKNKGTDGLCLVGIRRGGEWLAEHIWNNIRKIENVEIPWGSVDIQRYRDDIGGHLVAARRPELPFDVTGMTVVMVDDVLYTGRTARAAMEAIITSGRPRAIQLAALIDRGHRELPIRADFVGKNVPTSHSEFIEVSMPPTDAGMRVCLMDLGTSSKPGAPGVSDVPGKNQTKKENEKR